MKKIILIVFACLTTATVGFCGVELFNSGFFKVGGDGVALVQPSSSGCVVPGGYERLIDGSGNFIDDQYGECIIVQSLAGMDYDGVWVGYTSTWTQYETTWQ